MAIRVAAKGTVNLVFGWDGESDMSDVDMFANECHEYVEELLKGVQNGLSSGQINYTVSKEENNTMNCEAAFDIMVPDLEDYNEKIDDIYEREWAWKTAK